MLLLNRGMMQYIKHPFTRNDLSITSLFYLNMWSGTALTQGEIDSINASQLASGRYNFTAITNILGAAGRTQLVWDGLNAIGMNLTTVKSNGAPDKVILPFSRIPNVIVGRVAGTISLAKITMYANPSASQTGVELLFSVGLIGSGADIELEDIQVEVGKRFRLNDVVINLENLLGEA